MQTILTKKQQKILVSDCDFKFLQRFSWSIDSGGYAGTNIKDDRGKWRRIRMHRFLKGAPKDMDIDHINGDRLDNRQENLRVCTRQENLRNSKKRKRGTSKYKGVYFSKRIQKWIARIGVNGVTKHIGCFEKECDAAKAYDLYAKKLFGEFALINN